jgi:hypothetical protein
MISASLQTLFKKSAEYISQVDEIKENEMDEVFSAYGEEKCIECFSEESGRKHHLKDLCVDGR